VDGCYNKYGKTIFAGSANNNIMQKKFWFSPEVTFAQATPGGTGILGVN